MDMGGNGMGRHNMFPIFYMLSQQGKPCVYIDKLGQDLIGDV